MPFFETVEMLPEDPILGLPKLFQANPNPNKVNLGIGAYRDSDGKPYVLTSVREVEKLLLEKQSSQDYLPIEGDPDYIRESLKVVFGNDSPKIASGEVFAAQALGGTGALRLGGEFLAREISKVIFISEPSWPNHISIFSRAGMRVELYKYYDEHQHRVDFAGLCATVKIMPPASVILLQACCHNPTGMDLTFPQWQELSDLIKQRQIFPFFDFAYQGFSKSLDDDAKPIRYFVEQGHEMIVASSYSKNFGLYGERVGLTSIITHKAETAQKIGTQIKQIIRGSYSNPPRTGASIVSTILQTPALRTSWLRELQAMRDRIVEMREALTFGLQAKSLHKDFSFLLDQKGIFSFSGLNREQVQRLRDERGIYMIGNGRMNVAGLNPHNLDYVIDSILAIVNNAR